MALAPPRSECSLPRWGRAWVGATAVEGCGPEPEPVPAIAHAPTPTLPQRGREQGLACAS